jgi:Tfp pilus assembly protein FimT
MVAGEMMIASRSRPCCLFQRAGVPGLMASQQLLHHARSAQTLTLARTEAVKHRYRVNVCKSADGRECADNAAGTWDSSLPTTTRMV